MHANRATLRLTTLALLTAAVAACGTEPAAEPEVTDCEFWQTAPQLIPNGGVETPIAFDALSAPSCAGQVLPKGRWLILAKVTWDLDSTGLRGSSIFVNDSIRDDEASTPFKKGPYTFGNLLSATVNSDGTAHVWVTGSQTATRALNTVPSFHTEHLTRLTFARLDH